MAKRRRLSEKRPPAAVDPRPARWHAAFLVLCVLGVLLGADLLRLHVRAHTDPGATSYCAVGESFDCDAVARSPWSVIAGLPLAVWGLVGYATMGLLAWPSAPRRRGASAAGLAAAWFLALGSAIAGVVLLWISHSVIGSLCLVCTASYGVNFLLAFAGWKALRGVDVGLLGALGQSRGWWVALGMAGVALVVLRATVPPYWHVEVRTGPGGVPTGVTADGHAWIGAPAPKLEIVEYSDYECPHCRERHAELRREIENHPSALRLVHRHFPLDQRCNTTIRMPFHQEACRFARLAWCAQEQGKFWEANDFLYAAHAGPAAPVTPARLADALGIDATRLEACEKGTEAARAIAHDVESGIAAGVTGTPAFVIEGRLYRAAVPEELLRAALGEPTATPPPGAAPPSE